MLCGVCDIKYNYRKEEKKTTTKTICSSEIIVRFLFLSISLVYLILLFFQTQNDMLVYFLPVYSNTFLHIYLYVTLFHA